MPDGIPHIYGTYYTCAFSKQPLDIFFRKWRPHTHTHKENDRTTVLSITFNGAIEISALLVRPAGNSATFPSGVREGTSVEEPVWV